MTIVASIDLECEAILLQPALERTLTQKMHKSSVSVKLRECAFVLLLSGFTFHVIMRVTQYFLLAVS